MLIRDDGSIAGTIAVLRRSRSLAGAREVIAQEKPRTLTFDLNQDPKYDTDSSAAARSKSSSNRCCPCRCSTFSAQAMSHRALQGRGATPALTALSLDDRERLCQPGALSQLRSRSSPGTSMKLSRSLRAAESSYIVIVTAATATTCGFCAGPCKRPLVTSAWSAPNAKPSQCFSRAHS